MSKTIRLTERASLVICLIFLYAATVAAQRGGTAGGGGSVRPERVPSAKPTPTPSPLSVTPLPTPTPTPRGKCDPSTVVGHCPGAYSFTYGFTANAAPRQGGAQTEKAGFVFTTYLTRRVLISISNDNVVSSKVEPAARVEGFGDTTVSVGADVVVESREKDSNYPLDAR